MLALIKQGAMEAVEASKPVAVMTGTITKLEPLTIFIHAKLSLTEDFLIITDTFAKKIITIDDKVVLLRKQGGNEYVVIDIQA